LSKSGKIIGIKNNQITLIDMKESAGKIKNVDKNLYLLAEKLSI